MDAEPEGVFLILIEERVAKLEEITLLSGSHDTPTNGPEGCAMEIASWLAGEPWSDHPPCVSPVIGSFLRRWNDDLDNEGSQMLKPHLPRVVGTNAEHDEERAWMLTDWLVRVCAPAWLELAGVEESPAALRSLPPITKETVSAAQPTIDKARKKGAAARAAGWAAAGAALEPTKVSLQQSALELLDRMIELDGPSS